MAAIQVIINFSRPGKGITQYIEGLVDDNPVRLKTLTQISPDFSLKWCKENWWLNGYIPHGRLISSVVKYLFYKEWFSVMELLDPQGEHLVYYVDDDTPISKSDGEYYLTDLFLDLWVAPDGTYIELDREEFEDSFQSGLITPDQHKKANHVIEILKRRIVNGEFQNMLH